MVETAGYGGNNLVISLLVQNQPLYMKNLFEKEYETQSGESGTDQRVDMNKFHKLVPR